MKTKSRPAGQISATNLAEVNATGELTVDYVLSRGSSAFPSALARAPLGMVFHPGAAADVEAFADNPIGTGPFQIESRDLDKLVFR